MTKICVLGLGYIGLPTASMFAAQGHDVLGVDVSEDVVARLSRGNVHIQEPGLHVLAQSALQSGRLRVSTTVEQADVHIIAVPTPVGVAGAPSEVQYPRPDLAHVKAASEAVASVLQPGGLVILESTSPPGTTENVVRPILERAGLSGGRDFLLAYCAERVLPGHILSELVTNDRVIGGVDSASSRRAAELYACFCEGTIYETSATTAEMVKVMENTFRDVNVALANEFSHVAEILNIDAMEAIDLANHHPRVNILKPGPGVGGHCIAVDPWFIVDAAPEHTALIQTSRRVNDAQPHHVADIIENTIGDLAHPVVAVLGLAYKGDVDDLRESPAVDVVRDLQYRHITVRAHDPLVEHAPADIELHSDLTEVLRGADILVVLTDHTMYRNLRPTDAALAGVRHRRLMDARSCMSQAEWTAGGFTVIRLGTASAHTPGSAS